MKYMVRNVPEFHEDLKLLCEKYGLKAFILVGVDDPNDPKEFHVENYVAEDANLGDGTATKTTMGTAATEAWLAVRRRLVTAYEMRRR